MWEPPFVAPQEGQAPPIGDGYNPAPVTPGHSGGPLPPPTDVYIPPVGALDKDTVNSYVAPYLTPPPSAQGADQGLVHPTQAGMMPPAEVVNINPNGGIFGQASIRRGGAQTTRYLGLVRTFGSQTTDFGQNIDGIAKVRRSKAEDGPRQSTYPGQPNAESNHELSKPGAQVAKDEQFRVLFKGANLRSRQTIAPY
jgi:hypothetical protein